MDSRAKTNAWVKPPPPPPLPSNQEIRIIGSRLTTLLYFLTIFGYTPLDFRQLRHRIFEVHWRRSWTQFIFSLLFLYVGVENFSSFMLQRPIILRPSILSYATAWRSGLKTSDYSEGIQEIGQLAIRLVMGLIPLAILTGIGTLWISSGRLAQVLSGWRELEKRCYRTLPPQKISDAIVSHVLTQRNWIDRKLLYILASQAITGSFIWLFLMSTAHPSIPILSFDYGYFFLSGFLSITMDYLYETFNVAMMRCCEKAFRVIKECIETSVADAKESRRLLTASEVKALQDLVFEVRARTLETCKLQKLPLFACIAQLVGLAALSAFVTSISFRAFAGEQQSHLVLASSMWGFYTLCQVLRLGVKAHFGDLLADSEIAIRSMLEGTDDEILDRMAQSQLRILINTIRNSPCQAYFGTYAVLNKRLVLGVLQHIVGYIIIVLQFTQKNL